MVCEPSHPGRALNEHSGGGKEGGGGGRATPARIPPPKGSGERLLSTVSARNPCSLTLFVLPPLLALSTSGQRIELSSQPPPTAGPEDTAAAGRDKEGQREKPESPEEGRKGRKRWLEREVKKRNGRKKRKQRKEEKEGREWRRGLVTRSRRARSRVARGLLRGLSRCRSRALGLLRSREPTDPASRGERGASTRHRDGLRTRKDTASRRGEERRAPPPPPT